MPFLQLVRPAGLYLYSRRVPRGSAGFSIIILERRVAVRGLLTLRMPSEMSGQDVGWMAIEVVAPVVVAPGGAGIGMACSVLDVLQRDPCAQCLRDRRYLPWIRSIAWSERILGAEAREAHETRVSDADREARLPSRFCGACRWAWARGALPALGVIGWCP